MYVCVCIACVIPHNYFHPQIAYIRNAQRKWERQITCAAETRSDRNGIMTYINSLVHRNRTPFSKLICFMRLILSLKNQSAGKEYSTLLGAGCSTQNSVVSLMTMMRRTRSRFVFSGWRAFVHDQLNASLSISICSTRAPLFQSDCNYERRDDSWY